MSGLHYRGSGREASLDFGVQIGTVYHAVPMRRLVDWFLSSPLAILFSVMLTIWKATTTII